MKEGFSVEEGCGMEEGLSVEEGVWHGGGVVMWLWYGGGGDSQSNHTPKQALQLIHNMTWCVHTVSSQWLGRRKELYVVSKYREGRKG